MYRSNRRQAFSLIELLVAVAVLSLMVVLLAQMLKSASDGWLGGKARVNNFMKARSMMDLLARDIQGGIYRDDLAAFAEMNVAASRTNVAFYTKRSGVPASAGTPVRGVSLVEYSLAPDGMLKRGDMPIPWTGGAQSTTFGITDALPRLDGIIERDTVPGALGMKVLFLQTNGALTTDYDPLNKPKGAAIGMAFVDDVTLKKLTAGQVAALQSAFNSSLSGTNSIKADWNAYLNGSMNWSSYPSDLGRGLKVFERYVIFP